MIVTLPSHTRICGVLLLALSLCHFGQESFAQSEAGQYFRVLPLPQTEAQATALKANLRTTNSDTLTLPFWDDFSNVRQGQRMDPDTTLWAEGSASVRINTGAGIHPPSVGIATFDGVDASGVPYSPSDANSGLADELISKPLNLAVVPPSERDRVFLSFFWQQAGRGEFPDAGDSLRLQFLDIDGNWDTIWKRDGGDTLSVTEFEQEMIQILDPAYFHEGFQFRFQSYNRLSGAFDTWHVDYVYLNSGRSASNTAYLDRALTSLPTSPFGKYTAVPMRQFRWHPERYSDTSSVGFYNLGALLQPVRFSALLTDAGSGEQLQVLTDDNALSPVPSGFSRREITSGPLIAEALPTEADSLYIRTTFFITSGDSVLEGSINYLSNDTVSSIFSLDEVFAYDDGEAEFGVELNQNGGRVAYEFVASPDSSALLTHIDVYFPPLTRNQNNLPIRLIVWKTLEDSLGQEIEVRTQASTVKSAGSLNEYITYELDFPVVVKDTFYIGYEQQGDSFVAIGFDKNTDASDKIYFNVTGVWEQDSELQGSLMMRPGFARDRIITSNRPEIQPKKPAFLLYPNPSEGSFRVEGEYDQLKIYDLNGRLLRSYARSQTADTMIDTGLSRGVYVLQIIGSHGSESRKLIIR